MNKFCGEARCKLQFVHWHEAGDFGHVHVPPPPVTHIVDKSERGDSAVKALIPADKKENFDEHDIAAALLKMPVSSDPAADRFKGKSQEEIQLILLHERIAKMAEQTDKTALDTSVTRSCVNGISITLAAAREDSRDNGALLAKIEHTIEECWTHWRNDQQQPAWAKDFAVWILAQVHSEADFKLLRGDVSIVNDGVNELTKAVVERYNLANKRSQELTSQISDLGHLVHKRLPSAWGIAWRAVLIEVLLASSCAAGAWAIIHFCF